MMSKMQEPEEILRARARALAQPRGKPPAAGSQLEILEFRLAAERYAVETKHVQEVHPFRDLTPLPCTPAFVLGVVNLRGRILPVLDLKKFFELPERGLTDLHRIIRVSGNDLDFGLLADVVVGTRTIAADTLLPSLPTLTGIRQDYLKGVDDERLVVLDLARMLSDPKIIVHEEVAT
jgi:purine-binding chemotaxis protein CheW